MSVYTIKTELNQDMLDCPIQSQPSEKCLVNAVTGQEIEILYSNGPDRILEIATFFPAKGLEPPFHCHPFQDEFYFVNEGSLTLKTKLGKKVYQKGQLIHIRKNQAHSIWNAGESHARANWRTFPALQTEAFLLTLWLLADQGKTDSHGIPRNCLRIETLLRFASVYRSPKFKVIIGISWLQKYLKKLF